MLKALVLYTQRNELDIKAMGNIRQNYPVKHIQVISFIIALLGLVSSLAVYYSTSYSSFRDFAYNSDALYLPALFNDIIHGASLSGWKLPPAPYFFPDMVFFFLIRAVTPSIHVAIYVYGIIQITLFTLGLALLAKNILPISHGLVRYTLIVLMAIIFISSIDKFEFWTKMIFLSSYHFGLLLALPYFLTLSCTILSIPLSKYSVGHGIALFLLSFMISVSDSLYIIQIALPLCFTATILLLIKKTFIKSMLFMESIMFLSVMGGFVLCQKVVTKYKTLYLFYNPLLAPVSFSNFLDSIKGIILVVPYHAFLIGIFFSLCSFALIKEIIPSSWFPHGKTSTTVKDIIFPLFFLLYFVISSMSIVGSGIFINRNGLHYFLPLLIIPAYWGMPFVVGITSSIKKLAFSNITVGILALVMIVVVFKNINLKKIEGTFEKMDYYPSFVQCVDENASRLHIRCGVSNYWGAKYISILSKKGLQVVQLSNDLSPFHWINNLAWFEIEPEFALIDTSIPDTSPFHLDENLIFQRFGKPVSIFRCGNSKLFVYNRPTDIGFKMMLKKSPAMAKIQKPGDAFEFYAAYLPSRTGTIDEYSRTADQSPADFLSYGPYVSIPSGEYSFEIHYTARYNNKRIGFWDIGISKPKEIKIILSGDILSNDNIVKSSFHIPEPSVIEIRVFYEGKGYLKLEKIRLEKNI